MLPQLRRLTIAFAAAFLALALLPGWWGLYRAPALTGRLDNPRRSLAERYTRRGQILDRDGSPLAASAGEHGEYRRVYPVPEAAPVVGYNSPRYGQAGLEAVLDPVLSGRAGRDPARAWWENLLHGGPATGNDVQLTLDASLQKAAASAIGQAHGAIVLLDAVSGEVLVLLSSPTFDPDTLDENWERLSADRASPLFNRATQGQYPPGGILQPVILAAALQAGLADPGDVYRNGAAAIRVEGQFIGCAEPFPQKPGFSEKPGFYSGYPPAGNQDRGEGRHGYGPLTLAGAFTLSCPSPFADLGQVLGPDRLLRTFDAFQLLDPPSFDLPAGASGPLSISPSGAWLEAIGQGKLGISPLRMALVTAALANRGRMPDPRLVVAVAAPAPYIRPDVASEIAALMGRAALTETGQLAGMVEADVAGHFASALTGQSGPELGWFIGFTPIVQPRYAVAVVLEGQSPQLATIIGTQLLARTAPRTRKSETRFLGETGFLPRP